MAGSRDGAARAGAGRLHVAGDRLGAGRRRARSPDPAAALGARLAAPAAAPSAPPTASAGWPRSGPPGTPARCSGPAPATTSAPAPSSPAAAPTCVVTAAHCVTSGPGLAAYADLEYAPAYRHGTAPFGVWKAARVTVDPRWTAARRPGPRRRVHRARAAERPAGGRRGRRRADRVRRPGSGPVRLTGYPDGADDPLTCLGTMTQRDDGQLRVECTGYAPGTSGTPWLTDFDPVSPRTWAVVGVIGGYQLGGDTDDVSYSPYFGPDVQHLYQQAVQGA